MTVRHDAGRTLALVLAATRCLVGVTALVVPEAVARPWVGRVAEDEGARVLSRALGGRDLALGLGALSSGGHRRALRGWVAAAALADAGDVLATLAAWSSLPRRGRIAVLGAAGAGTLGGAIAAACL